MKTIKNIIFLMICSLSIVYSQTIDVKGVVKDGAGESLPGVNVIVKGTTNGTQTDFDGNYTIEANKGDVLVFSFIGMNTKSAVVSSSNMNIILVEDSQQLEEVVVTALGIKRSKKELGFAVQDVKSDELGKSGISSAAAMLSGKVSGVDISMPSTGAAGSTRVTIRGISDIGGNNQPLYVVDGIPIDNGSLADEASGKYYDGKDRGDGISGINPDDIESISVLKGAAAAALYGSRANNGVILITTKKGKSGKLSVELTSGITIDQVDANYEDYQREYGGGANGEIPSQKDVDRVYGYTTSAWGAKFSDVPKGTKALIFDGSYRDYVNVDDNINKFFRTGITYNNGIALQGGNENTTFRFSYNNLNNEDVIPQSSLEKNIFNLIGSAKYGKLSVEAKANYIVENTSNRPGLGDSPSNIGYSLSGLSPNINQSYLKNYRNANGDYNKWNGNDFLLNPYYVVDINSNKTTKNRIIGYVNANYKFADWISLQFRTGIDKYDFDMTDYTGAGHTWGARDKGHLYLENTTVSERNTDVIANISGIKLSDNWDFSSIIGAGRRDYSRETNSTSATEEIEVGKKYISNFNKPIINTPNISKKRINSVYSSMKFAYKRYLYLEFTGRNDWFSTITKNRSSFYPSASVGFVFTDALGIESDVLSWGKFRASWAQVASEADPYNLALNYTTQPAFNGNTVSNIKNTASPDANYTRRLKTAIEFGFDLSFFNNRLKTDISVYREDTADQPLALPASATSGYTNIAVNAGKIRNEGIEVLVTGTPIKNENFEWEVGLNFSKNRNEVLELHPLLDTYVVSDARWAGASIVAKVGEKFGSIIGKDFKRNDSGQVIHSANGMPEFTDNKVVLGNGLPDWTAGITNRFKYKNISLRFLFDVKVGADIFSMTNAIAANRGLLDVTTEGRDAYYKARREAEKDPNFDKASWTPDIPKAGETPGGYVSKGVVQVGVDKDGNPKYEENKKPVNPQDYWGSVFANTPQPFIYDASYVKLRELSVGYDLPKKFLEGTFVSSVNFSVIARNLFTISSLPNIDPESMYTSGNGQGFEYGSLPFRKSYGFNLKVSF